MSDKTKIEWTDATWNPVTGCTKVSPGCDHCYAETFAERFRGTPGHYFENGFDVQLRPDKLDQPLRWKKPRRIFVNSMSDLFHQDVPDNYIGSVFDVMARTPQHTYQILTKRHGRMRSLLNKWAEQATLPYEGASFRRHDMMWCGPRVWPLPNVWLGVSVENQQWADIRIPALLDTPAAARFLSCEPLLGPVDLARFTGEPSGLRGDWEHLIDWVIVGGESGRDARPMHPDWPRALRDQCQAAGVPFLFKQWGEWRSTNGAVSTHRVEYGGEFYPNTPACVMSNEEMVSRVGKRAAGRVLDGRTWDEFPA